MGQSLSKNKKKVEALSKQLREEQAKRDEDLKAKDRELQAVKDQTSKATKAADDLKRRSQLLEAQSAALQKQNQERASGVESLTKERDQAQSERDNNELRARAAEYAQKRQKKELDDAREAANQQASEASSSQQQVLDQRRRDLEAQTVTLTQQRDQAQSERDHHELRARAAEYAQKRHKKEAEDAKEAAKQEASEASASQRQVLDQRRRDLEAQTVLLTSQRDQAQSERDHHELQTRALAYSHQREKKAAAETAQTETAGVRQAHEALLQYHDIAKKDWNGLLLQLQYGNDALRLQKKALHGAYDDNRDLLKQLQLENEALRLQKTALHGAYDDNRDLLKQLQLENEALRLQKQALIPLAAEVPSLRSTRSALAEYHRKKDINANAMYAALAAEVAALYSTRSALAEYHRQRGIDTDTKQRNLEAENADLRSTRSALVEHHRQRHLAADAKHRNLEAENADLRSTRTALVEHHRQRHADADAKYKSLEAEHRGAQHEVTAVRNTNSALVEYHRKKGIDANAKYAYAQDEIAASRSLHKDLGDAHSLSQKQLAAAHAELADSQQQHAQVKGLHEQLQKDSAERFSKQQGELEAERAKQVAMQKEHEDAVKRLGLDHAAQLDKANQSATSAQNEKTSLESKVKQLETEKEQHIQTQVGLSNQLADAKANIARLEKDSLERKDSAVNGVKMDSPQQPSVQYNYDNI